MAKTRDRLMDRADEMRPYVDRALHDEDLRDNLKEAYVAARMVYDELIGNRGAIATAQRVATDKDIQEHLRKALDELRTAADRVQGKKRNGRNRFLLVLGVVLAVLFNPVTGPPTRKWVADKLTGGDEDYDYSSGAIAGNGGTSATAPASTT